MIAPLMLAFSPLLFDNIISEIRLEITPPLEKTSNVPLSIYSIYSFK